jgi:hypothetical protein
MVLSRILGSMTRPLLSLFALALAGELVLPGTRAADATNATPDFKEVYDLLRTNLTGATEESLNRAAVEGLLSRFPGKISLVGGTADRLTNFPGGSALSKSAIVESNVAYLRISGVVDGLADELRAAYRALTATNRAAGTVLDLRYADGDDSGSAQAAVNLFTTRKIAAGVLVVLVNGETRGAAETLAAALRHAGAGLIIGSPTAGEPATFKEFHLHNGQRLRITTTPGPGSGQASPSGSLQPDIAVAVNANDERTFWNNPYAPPANENSAPGSSTNNLLPYVDHTSEADLVRQRRKDGKFMKAPATHEDLIRGNSEDREGNEDSAPARAAEPKKPALRDPVLARAVDLIKGLAVVRQSHP